MLDPARDEGAIRPPKRFAGRSDTFKSPSLADRGGASGASRQDPSLRFVEAPEGLVEIALFVGIALRLDIDLPDNALRALENASRALHEAEKALDERLERLRDAEVTEFDAAIVAVEGGADERTLSYLESRL